MDAPPGDGGGGTTPPAPAPDGPPPGQQDGAAAAPPPEEAGAAEPAAAAAAEEEDQAAPVVPAAHVGAHPPPSPLSGGYLLIIIGEPHSAEHRDLILQRVAKGFLSWDSSDCHVDLEKELSTLSSLAPKGEESRNGERLVQYASESLVTEVLVHPQVNTLLQCVRNLLSSFTRHRHILHAGYTFAGTGSWILQDGTFSYADLSELFHEPDVQRVLRAYENSVSVDVHCCAEGPWRDASASAQPFSRYCKVRVNPPDVLTAGSPSITGFIDYVSEFVQPAALESLLEPSDVVGNIRFSHPTLYVFPGGQGDAALFGINGFNMLVDGGFGRKSCFWDFARHLDRLDAVLLTRLNNANAHGLASLLRRKRNAHVYPQIGHFFCNLQDRKVLTSPDGDKDRDNLLVSLVEEGQEMVLNLRELHLKPSPCYRDSVVEPVNLYHKVGHGKLDMYVVSPARDSKEVKEFLARWTANDAKLFASHLKKDSRDFQFPLQNMVSICALLVWQPANPQDNITRILFPGSTPQVKIFEGLDKIRHLEYLKHPRCTAKSLSPSPSIVGLSAKTQARKYTPTVLDKITPGEQQKTYSRTVPTSETNKHHVLKTATIPIAGGIPDTKVYRAANTTTTTTTTTTTKTQVLTKKVEKLKTEPEKQEKEATLENKLEDVQNNKEEKIKESLRARSKPRQSSHSKERKILKSAEKKDAEKKEKKEEKTSPTTPKKTIDSRINGTSRSESTARVSNRSSSKTRRSPSATPAKSAKEANNRKVAESKTQAIRAVSLSRTSTVKSTKKDEIIESAAKVKQADKTISRRPKAVSPSKTTKVQGSPAKTQAKPAGVKAVARKSRATEKSEIPDKIEGNDQKAKGNIVATSGEHTLVNGQQQNNADNTESKSVAVAIVDTNVTAEEKLDVPVDNATVPTQSTTSEEDEKKSEGEMRSMEGEEEEDEYLVIEKEEPYTEESLQEQESAESHVPVALDDRGVSDEDDAEDEKLKRDTQESEKVKDIEKPRKKSEAKLTVQLTDKEHAEQIAKTSTEELEAAERKLSLKSSSKIDDVISPGDKEKLFEEVQGIISSATELVCKKEEKASNIDSEDILKQADESKSEEKVNDDVKITESKQVSGDQKEESQPDEKISTTVESGATTAPTLPEDERIPLDNIKEVVEEKHVLEDTKEKENELVKASESQPEVCQPGRPAHFHIQGAASALHRDIIKTPDEVADLPVDEEYDPSMYSKDDVLKSPSEDGHLKEHPATGEVEVTAVEEDKKVASPEVRQMEIEELEQIKEMRVALEGVAEGVIPRSDECKTHTTSKVCEGESNVLSVEGDLGKESREQQEKDVDTKEICDESQVVASLQDPKKTAGSELTVEERSDICVSLEELRILGHEVEDIKPSEIKREDDKYSDIEPRNLVELDNTIKETGGKPVIISILHVGESLASEISAVDKDTMVSVIGVPEPLEAVQEDVYLESSVEEEPIYGKTDAPTLPEYVTVTPDSSPEGPKSPEKRKSISGKESRKSSGADKLSNSKIDHVSVISSEDARRQSIHQSEVEEGFDSRKSSIAEKGVDSGNISPTKIDSRRPSSVQSTNSTGKPDQDIPIAADAFDSAKSENERKASLSAHSEEKSPLIQSQATSRKTSVDVHVNAGESQLALNNDTSVAPPEDSKSQGTPERKLSASSPIPSEKPIDNKTMKTVDVETSEKNEADSEPSRVELLSEPVTTTTISDIINTGKGILECVNDNDNVTEVISSKSTESRKQSTCSSLGQQEPDGQEQKNDTSRPASAASIKSSTMEVEDVKGPSESTIHQEVITFAQSGVAGEDTQILTASPTKTGPPSAEISPRPTSAASNKSATVEADETDRRDSSSSIQADTGLAQSSAVAVDSTQGLPSKSVAPNAEVSSRRTSAASNLSTTLETEEGDSTTKHETETIHDKLSATVSDSTQSFTATPTITPCAEVTSRPTSAASNRSTTLDTDGTDRRDSSSCINTDISQSTVIVGDSTQNLTLSPTKSTAPSVDINLRRLSAASNKSLTVETEVCEGPDTSSKPEALAQSSEVTADSTKILTTSPTKSGTPSAEVTSRPTSAASDKGDGIGTVVTADERLDSSLIGQQVDATHEHPTTVSPTTSGTPSAEVTSRPTSAASNKSVGIEGEVIADVGLESSPTSQQVDTSHKDTTSSVGDATQSLTTSPTKSGTPSAEVTSRPTSAASNKSVGIEPEILSKGASSPTCHLDESTSDNASANEIVSPGSPASPTKAGSESPKISSRPTSAASNKSTSGDIELTTGPDSSSILQAGNMIAVSSADTVPLAAGVADSIQSLTTSPTKGSTPSEITSRPTSAASNRSGGLASDGTSRRDSQADTAFVEPPVTDVVDVSRSLVTSPTKSHSPTAESLSRPTSAASNKSVPAETRSDSEAITASPSKRISSESLCSENFEADLKLSAVAPATQVSPHKDDVLPHDASDKANLALVTSSAADHLVSSAQVGEVTKLHKAEHVDITQQETVKLIESTATSASTTFVSEENQLPSNDRQSQLSDNKEGPSPCYETSEIAPVEITSTSVSASESSPTPPIVQDSAKTSTERKQSVTESPVQQPPSPVPLKQEVKATTDTDLAKPFSDSCKVLGSAMSVSDSLASSTSHTPLQTISPVSTSPEPPFSVGSGADHREVESIMQTVTKVTEQGASVVKEAIVSMQSDNDNPHTRSHVGTEVISVTKVQQDVLVAESSSASILFQPSSDKETAESSKLKKEAEDSEKGTGPSNEKVLTETGCTKDSTAQPDLSVDVNAATAEDERRSGATTPSILVTGCKTLARQSQPSESDSEMPEEDFQKRQDDVFEVVDASKTVTEDPKASEISAESRKQSSDTQSVSGDGSILKTTHEFLLSETQSHTDVDLSHLEKNIITGVSETIVSQDAKLTESRPISDAVGISSTVLTEIAAVEKAEAATSPMTPIEPGSLSKVHISQDKISSNDVTDVTSISHVTTIGSDIRKEPTQEKKNDTEHEEPEFTLVSKSVHEEYINVPADENDGDCKKLAATTTVSTFTAKDVSDSPKHGDITKTVTTVTKVTKGGDGAGAVETTTTEEVQTDGKVTSVTTKTESSPLHKKSSEADVSEDATYEELSQSEGLKSAESSRMSISTDSAGLLLQSTVVNVIDGVASVAKQATGGFEDAMSAGLSVLTSVIGVRKDSLEATRSCTPGSDVEIEPSTPRSDVSSGQVSRVPTDYRLESEDEDAAGSPTSLTSQLTHSPPPPHFDFEIGDPHRTITGGLPGIRDDQCMLDSRSSTTHVRRQTIADPMMTSVYSEFSSEPLEELSERQSDIKLSETALDTVTIKGGIMSTDLMSSSVMGSLTSADVAGFDQAVEEHRTARGSDLTRSTENIQISENVASSDTQSVSGDDSILKTTREFLLSETQSHTDEKSRLEEASALPASEREQPHLTSVTGPVPPPKNSKDPIEDWGKPLGLPSPAPPPNSAEESAPSPKGTPQKDKLGSRKAISDNKRRPESPRKSHRVSKGNPIYIDLTYVPHHGNSYYASLEFFKRVRARYYVFSGIEPSREVYNALLEAKQSWEDKDLEVTIIPTYDTDTLGYWVAENEDALAKYKIDLSPSASRCTINLQDHETSCSAYRLEF